MIGKPETIRLAWDAIRPGGTAVVVGLVAEGVEASMPAIEFLSDKSLRGTYYGSGDPAAELPGLAALALAGDLDLAGVVTHVAGLDGVEAALDRLRRGRARVPFSSSTPTSPVPPHETEEHHEHSRRRRRRRSRIRSRAFIDGEYADAISGETFDCISPIDGSTLAQVAACDDRRHRPRRQGRAPRLRLGRVVADGAEEAQAAC